MSRIIKKISLFLLALISLITIPTMILSASSYNYDYWKNIVPSSEGLSHKDTYYGKDIPFGGSEQSIWTGTQKDGTKYSTEELIWIRKETIVNPGLIWDVNQWKFDAISDDPASLGKHDIQTQLEGFRAPIEISIKIPGDQSEVVYIRGDAEDELNLYIGSQLGTIDDYTIDIQTVIKGIVDEANEVFKHGEEIDDLVEAMAKAKNLIYNAKTVFDNNPTNIDDMRNNAYNGVLAYINIENYSHENKLRVDGYLADAKTHFDTITDYLDLINAYDKAIKDVDEVMVLTTVFVDEIFISEYGHMGGNNKYIEIYNGTSSDIDLANYALMIYNGGLSAPITDSALIKLTGTLIKSNTYIIADTNANASILAKADFTCDLAFDGNDAIALMEYSTSSKTWSMLDLFGSIINQGSLNAGIKEIGISYEDMKIYNDQIYLLDAKKQHVESVTINGVTFDIQGRSGLFIINDEMKWLQYINEFVISDDVKDKLDDFYAFDTPLDQITRMQVTSIDLKIRAPYVPYSQDTSKAAIHLRSAEGLAVTNSGIYIADTQNSRIIKMNFDYLVTEVFLTPNYPIFFQIDDPDDSLETTTKSVFKPAKLAVNEFDNVYVVAHNIYEGIMEYGANGIFNRFMGKNVVIANPLKAFWAKVFSEMQLATIALDLPPVFTNITIDSRGFLYTTSRPDPDDPTAAGMIKSINSVGKDVLRRNGYVAPDGDTTFISYSTVKGAILGPTRFVGITVNGIGNYTVIDQNRGRLFTYDSEGNLLYISGEKGNTSDTLNNPVAVNYYTITSGGEETELVLVLDQASKSIISFATTEFGNLINKATELYLDNEVTEAEAYWREVIKMNSNYELGYVGIGKSLHRNGEYKEAMKYFKLGHSSAYYSKSFQQYRDNLLKENFDLIMTGVLALIFVFGSITLYKFYTKRQDRTEEGGVND